MNASNTLPDGRIVDERTQRILLDIAKRLPAYLRLGTRLMRDERIPKRHKAPLAGALGYTVSPVDLIPGIIPLLGQLDDLLVLLGALRFTLNHIDPALAEEHTLACGLSRDQLDEDLRATTEIAKRVGRAGARGMARLARSGAKATGRLANKGYKALRRSPRSAEATVGVEFTVITDDHSNR